jgi:putative lipase involved disintegration of autophagic bodies
MSASSVDYAKINCAVKKMEPVGEYRPMGFKYSTGFINDGFWGCLYVNEATKECIVAFKGTGSAKVSKAAMEDDDLHDFNRKNNDHANPNHSIVGDLTADLKLMVGVIPNQASTAAKLFKRSMAVYSPEEYTYTLTGHSLGGYLAQVVSYWYNFPCVTFNAPGAWGDLQKAKLNLFKPQVLWRSLKATFKFDVVGMNFIHVGDIIGNYGLHRGRTQRVAGVSHMMKAICKTIEGHPRWSKCSPFDTRTGLAGLWDRY